MIKKAREMCRHWHRDQNRKYTGEPYYLHPYEVADILKEAGMSEEVQIAGLLHDTIEDCGILHSDISAMFGKRVADLVLMVTDVSKPEDGNRKSRKLLDLKHLAKADSDGQTIKLADLISNTSSIVQHDPGFAVIYMQEKRDLLNVLIDGDENLWFRAKAIVDHFFLNSSPEGEGNG